MVKNQKLENAPLQGKRVLILGLARSGQAAAQLVAAVGGIPVLYDRKREDTLEDVSFLQKIPSAEKHFGEPLEPLLKTCDFGVFGPGVGPSSPDMLVARGKLPLFGEMEFAFNYVPCPMLAVTGTNGKTTTVSLLKDMLNKAGYVTYAAGNIGYPLSAAALCADKDARIVAEVSSFQLESTLLFKPHIAAVLNITPDHLDRHGSMERYIELKKHIFCQMMNDDIAVLNPDDPIVATFAHDLKTRIAWFSADHETEQGAFVQNGNIMIRWQGAEKTICPVDEVLLPGKHNLQNALAASMMAFASGIPSAVVRHSLRTFKGVEHRIEFVKEVDGVRYINDSKGTNPDSTVQAVRAMKRPTVLILGGYDKKVSFRELAKVIKAQPLIRTVVTMGQTGPIIAQTLEEIGFEQVVHTTTLEEAVAAAKNHVTSGETVLFSPACASFDQFKDYEQRGRIFKEIVRSMISKTDG